MKHKFSFKVTLWWVLALLFLGVSLLVFGEKDARQSLMENRMLAGFPRLSLRGVFSGDFMTEFENYLSDSFFSRSELVALSEDALGLFSRRNAEDVITQDIGGAIEDEFDARSEPTAAPDEPDAAPAAPTPLPAPTPEPVKREYPVYSERVSLGSAVNERDTAYTPLSGYNFWMLKTDGTRQLVYDYTPKSIETLMAGLNAFRAALPEDGAVHFALVPVAQSANWWTRNTDKFCGWLSNAEEYMEALADDGVYIYNAPAILAEGLANGEYLYYRTDHHWTPRGAYKVASAMLQRQGLPVTSFQDYQYKVNTGYLGSIYTENPSAALKAMADDIEIPSSLAPVHSYVVHNLTASREIAYMREDWSNYLAYLQGTQTPWRRIVSGASTGRKALVIADSFGNCFAPYLLPYYDEVHMVDLRKGNFSIEEAGGSVGDYMSLYGVDDVYVVLSTASGLNYNFTQKYLLQYLR
ncbi:MAG: hypothetical protein IKO07_01975 [Clostridia bacterium]|nr:hypothetical protein [Clostridia bacterium]